MSMQPAMLSCVRLGAKKMAVLGGLNLVCMVPPAQCEHGYSIPSLSRVIPVLVHAFFVGFKLGHMIGPIPAAHKNHNHTYPTASGYSI